MADSNSTPLLTNKENNPTIVNNNSVDDIIEFYMGALRSPQIIQVILISFSCFFEAQQTFISIFTDAKPTWHCLESPCNQESNICELQTSAWSYDNAHAYIISEFSLQCLDSIVTGLPASCFFMGCLLGGLILLLVGDSFGRKTVLSLSCFVMCVASICCAFSRNIRMYSASRFVSGLGRAAIGTCSLVLATESVGKKWQGRIGTVSFFMSTLGFLSLSIIAYFNRNYSWRVLYLVTSLPGIVYCLLIQFCGYESPRWLFSQGKERQAFGVLSSFAGTDLSSTTTHLGDILLAKGNSNESNKKKPFLKILVESRNFLKQFLMVLAIGIGIGITYYGVPLGIGNLDSNIYFNSALNALIEVPSVLLTLFTISKWKRRYSIIGLCTLGGCCGILSFTLRNWNGIEIVMAMISLFCACTAYDVILIYTSELFPTCFRNSAVSTVWQAVVLGGVISPVVNAAFGNYIRLLPYGIFGVVIFSFGTLVILLPETLGVSTSADSV